MFHEKEWPICVIGLPCGLSYRRHHSNRRKSRKIKKNKRQNGASLPVGKEQMVEQAIRDKALSKACKLLSTEDSDAQVDMEAEMKKLHPDGPSAHVEYIPGQLSFSAKDMESAIKSFPPGSSGGPSGLRASHLKDMLKTKERQKFLTALAAFCSRIANGGFSPECMKLLTASRLIAVPKTSGGIRPIAVGETFRRLAAKCVLKSTEDTLKEYLSPEQVGVAIPNATETTARRVRLWLQHAGPNHVMLQVDMKNAFGSVFRDRMLSELRTHCPALYPYAAACYRNPNLLMGDGFAMNSSRGVQQGDDGDSSQNECGRSRSDRANERLEAK